MENQVKVKEEEKVEVKVREDLNDMVKTLGMVKIESRYGDRYVCRVKLFNNEVIDFSDKEDLYHLFDSYQKAGVENFIKSKKLVEEIKKSKVDTIDGEVDSDFYTYVCVVYELTDGSTFRLFPSRKRVDRRIIDNYYKLWKKQQNVKKG